jgi:hypothetical protein
VPSSAYTAILGMFPLIPSSLSVRPVDQTEIITIVAAAGFGLTRPDMSGCRENPPPRAKDTESQASHCRKGSKGNM